MNDTNLFGAWSVLAGALHLLFQRMPSPDPRKFEVNNKAMAAGERAVQSVGMDNDPLEEALLKLAGRVAAIDFQDHIAFDLLMSDIEAVLED